MRKTTIRAEFEVGEPRTFASRAQLAKRAAQYHPLDGQLVPRSGDAGLLAAIVAGEVPSCSDADWLADKSKRGMYTLGDGSTNIRLPDWNGKSTDSLGSLVIRGDGKNADAAGLIQSDCIRPFSGEFNVGGSTGTVIDAGIATGVFKRGNKIYPNFLMTEPMPQPNASILFSIDDQVPTGPENRMVNTAGVHAVKR